MGDYMKKFNVFAVLTGVLAALPICADAAYPVYQAAYPTNVAVPSYQANTPQGQVMYLPSANSRVVNTNQNVVQQQAVVRNNAAQPTRITGQLPRVGSRATNAGRQYYQASDYDR